MRSLVLAAAAVSLLLAAAASATAEMQAFPVVDATLHPSADEGSPPGFDGRGELMRATAGASGQAVFVPALGVLGVEAPERSWWSESVGGATYRLPRDAVATLQFRPLHVEALAAFTVEVHAVDAEGRATLLGAATRTFNLPRLLPAAEEFQVPVAGEVLPRGHALLLVVRADALDVLSVVEYGAGTKTALRLSYQILDTDGDGVPDDGDPCPTEADCDGDGTPDGNAPRNGTTVHEHHSHYYDATPGTGAPGMPGAPGSPGAPGAPAPPLPTPTPDEAGGADGRRASGDDLRRIEATAGGLALATGSTVTALTLLRRRP